MASHDFKISSKAFRVLGSESGIRIFELLARKKELCVSDIARKIRLSMPAASYQLQRMEVAGLLNSFRMGRTICYTPGKSRFTADLIRCLKNLPVKKSR